ncbi:MAG TPA: hypothetical protein VNO21_13810 [Polyangiaceae bacterium]|nr:hypothetical protein [Polyangiaceae bacterium]
MISFRSVASAVAPALLGLGLMGCVNEAGRAQPQMSGLGANNDPSSQYQPDPNWRAPAVSPPPTVTGATGNGNTTASCTENEGAQGLSPNRRLCP